MVVIMGDEELKKEAKIAVKQLRSIGLCDDEVMNFIDESVEKNCNGQCDPVSYFKIPHHIYLNEIGNKVMTMNDEQLGAFVRKTLWTVTGKR